MSDVGDGGSTGRGCTRRTGATGRVQEEGAEKVEVEVDSILLVIVDAETPLVAKDMVEEAVTDTIAVTDIVVADTDTDTAVDIFFSGSATLPPGILNAFALSHPDRLPLGERVHARVVRAVREVVKDKKKRTH